MVLPLVALVVPSGLVLAGPLQSNGWPARLLVFWIAVAFVVGWVARRRRLKPISPAEVGCWVLLGATIASVLAGGLRHLNEAESAGLLRAALVIVPLLVTALGIAVSADRRRIDTMLILVVVGASASALVGVIQFVTPFDLMQILDMPGLAPVEGGGQGTRDSFLRVRGSAAHPIELSVISAAALPLALHFARFASTPRGRRLAIAALTVLAVAIPMSVSRSGVVVAVVAMLVYGFVLNARQRLTALVIVVVGAVLFRAAVPGLLGAVRSLFLGLGSDDSISGRTEDYAAVGELIADNQIVGRGLGTFRPEEYFFLDNQYLMSLIEGGYVGLAGLIAWFVLAIASARGAYLRSVSEQDRSVSQAVVAAIVSIAVSAVLFDLFSFGQATVLAFLLVGLAGALWHENVAHGRAIAGPAGRLRMAWHGCDVKSQR